MQFVWTSICYVNRIFLAISRRQILILVHNPG
jgi:hypothetical protein